VSCLTLRAIWLHNTVRYVHKNSTRLVMHSVIVKYDCVCWRGIKFEFHTGNWLMLLKVHCGFPSFMLVNTRMMEFVLLECDAM
jgi:hypothetical protein